MNQTDTKRSDPIDVAVEELEAWKRRLTITVDAKRVLQARAKERKKLSKKLRIKGFRAGKVPTHIVEQRYGDLVDQRTVQSLVEDAYREAVRRQSLDPIGAPEFGQVNYAQGENLTFQVDVEIMPTLRGATGGGRSGRRADHEPGRCRERGGLGRDRRAERRDRPGRRRSRIGRGGGRRAVSVSARRRICDRRRRESRQDPLAE
jgi:hypothetical protein